jgi:hypothetical protein
MAATSTTSTSTTSATSTSTSASTTSATSATSTIAIATAPLAVLGLADGLWLRLGFRIVGADPHRPPVVVRVAGRHDIAASVVELWVDCTVAVGVVEG